MPQMKISPRKKQSAEREDNPATAKNGAANAA
jgi:hypothetical protein